MPRDGSILNPRQQIKKLEREKNEQWFVTQWKIIGGPEYEREFKFHSTRDYRADFCWPSIKCILEVDGGGHRLYWNKYHQDIEKQNDAHFEGWRIFRLTRKMIADDDVQFLENLKSYVTGKMAKKE